MHGSTGVAQWIIMSEDNPRPLRFSSQGVGFGVETCNGEASYARNSATFQGGMLRDTGHNLTEAIHLISLPLDSQLIRIADFGCGVGANALAWADLATLASYRITNLKVPEAVQDVSSSAFNKGRVWVDGDNPVVAEVCAQVYRQDLLSFFTYRAYQLAPAGLLFVTCPYRAGPGSPEAQTSGEFQNASPCGGILEDSWVELVAEVSESFACDIRWNQLSLYVRAMDSCHILELFLEM